MKQVWAGSMLAAGLAFGTMVGAAQQTAPAAGIGAKAPNAVTPPAAGQAPAQAKTPLQLQSLDPSTRADPFPPVNPKYFTATTPTVATVDSYLHALLGWDANRIWRVEAIQKTAAPGVSKVIVYVSDRAANSKVQTAVFFITPDGKHALADTAVNPFGEKPYADISAMLKQRADGPFHGNGAKDLELVEFADLQCPHCKDAQAVMKRLVDDFPKAHIVYQNFPLTEIHPFAFKAAAFGVCAAKKSNDVFFTYAQAVYDTQGALTADTGDQTLKDAAAKAGLDPAATAACAATDATKGEVESSIKLAEDVGVTETPMIAINGRLLPLSIPYETLKSIIIFQAGLDGAGDAAVTAAGHGLIGR
ncbi:DsbA family protein [Granulicella tundricola]|nr:thioredoxin domain-containing protein [Granulicella tundricola]